MQQQLDLHLPFDQHRDAREHGPVVLHVAGNVPMDCEKGRRRRRATGKEKRAQRGSPGGQGFSQETGRPSNVCGSGKRIASSETAAAAAAAAAAGVRVASRSSTQDWIPDQPTVRKLSPTKTCEIHNATHTVRSHGARRSTLASNSIFIDQRAERLPAPPGGSHTPSWVQKNVDCPPRNHIHTVLVHPQRFGPMKVIFCGRDGRSHACKRPVT